MNFVIFVALALWIAVFFCILSVGWYLTIRDRAPPLYDSAMDSHTSSPRASFTIDKEFELLEIIVNTAPVVKDVVSEPRKLSRSDLVPEVANQGTPLSETVNHSVSTDLPVTASDVDHSFKVDVQPKPAEVQQASLIRSSSAPVSDLSVGCLSNALEVPKTERSCFLDNAKPSLCITYGTDSHIGSKPTQEDTCLVATESLPSSLEAKALVGVFDGHGGSFTSQYLRENLLTAFSNVEKQNCCGSLRSVLNQCDEDLYKAHLTTREDTSGSTAVVALIKHDEICVANIGDSRAVLSKNGIAKELTVDQKPGCEKEKNRILQAGGFLDSENYINGEIGVARALGNFHLNGLKRPPSADKQGPLISEPEIEVIPFGSDEEFLLLASDGLWDVMSSQRAIQIARSALMRNENCQAAAQEVVKEAKDLETRDNTTVIVVALKSLPLLPKTPSPRPRNPNSRLFRQSRSTPESLNEEASRSSV